MPLLKVTCVYRPPICRCNNGWYF